VYWNGTDTSSKNVTFKNNYKKMFGEEANPWAAIAYDSLTVVAESSLNMKDGLNGEKLQRALKKYSSQNLLTSDSFSFDQNNTPNKDVIIYRIDKKGIGFYGKR